jgi:hypothetical protein
MGKDEIYLFESDADFGVHLTPSDVLVKYMDEAYERVVLRHLDIDRN